jgi:hypothetical protein
VPKAGVYMSEKTWTSIAGSRNKTEDLDPVGWRSRVNTWFCLCRLKSSPPFSPIQCTRIRVFRDLFCRRPESFGASAKLMTHPWSRSTPTVLKKGSNVNGFGGSLSAFLIKKDKFGRQTYRENRDSENQKLGFRICSRHWWNSNMQQSSIIFINVFVCC